MDQSLTIGQFARLTHLPVKTLRHYHEVGVLVPADVDRHTGYRRYSTQQVADAHLVRRLRALDMPLARVRIVLEAPDADTRDNAILAYLELLDRELARTRAAVASLRALLSRPTMELAVVHRRLAAQPALAVTAVVDHADIGPWCAATFPRLYQALAVAGAEPVGPGGALYESDFFEAGAGHVVAFVPTAPEIGPEGVSDDQLRSFMVPAATVAVAVHQGPFHDLDRTYGALGSYVAESALATAGPVREHYLVSPEDTPDPAGWLTELCWPIDPAASQVSALRPTVTRRTSP